MEEVLGKALDWLVRSLMAAMARMRVEESRRPLLDGYGNIVAGVAKGAWLSYLEKPKDSVVGWWHLGPYLFLPCLGGVRSMGPDAEMADCGYIRLPD